MKKTKTISVSTKLAFRFTFILSAVVILLTVIFSRIQIADLNYQRSQELNTSISIISRLYNTHMEQSSDVPFTIARIPRHLNYIIYDAAANQIITKKNPDELKILEKTDQKTKIYTQKRSGDQDLKIIYIAHSLENYPDIVAQIWIDLQNDSLYQMRKSMPRIILLSLLPILIICFFIALFIARHIMKPVVKMTDGAKHISSSNLDSLLPVKKNGDELDELATTFNDLFKRLKIDFDRERQFTSDVSHELKTPVAVILGQANLIRRWGKDDPAQLEKSISTIISETKSMEAIIQNLLQMTRIESGRILPAKDEFLLSELTAKICQEVEVLSPDTVINLDCDQSLILNTDYELLHQVLMIIISNSLKFCPKPLAINLKAMKTGDRILIELSDNGPGFSSETVNHVFERFFRGDDSHTRSAGGSGLGLSIAKTIIESLNGKISASNDEKTKGAKLSIIL